MDDDFETWLRQVQEMGDNPTQRPSGVFWDVLYDRGLTPEEARQRVDDFGQATCPGCEAAFDEECSCLEEHDGRQSSLRKENPRESVKDFDKFMDKILISEGYGRPAMKPEDNPQRRRAARHQDRPGNKTRFGGK